MKVESDYTKAYRTKRKRVITAVFVAAVLAVGVLVPVSLLKERGGPPNIIVIMLDTLRQDELSLYGCPYDTSPFIDSIGRRGTVFSRVTAQSSYTAPSLASFLTSMYPSCHRAWGFGVILRESLTTLTEVFQDNGYRTGYFSAHWGLNEKSRYSQGADHFEIIDEGVRKGRMFPESKDAPPLFVRAEKVNEAVFQWLAEPDSRPTFLFVQYMDVHCDYNPPSPYREMFVKNSSISLPPEEEYALWETACWKVGLELPIEDRDVQYLRNLYRGEIAYLDSQIKALIDVLKQHKLYRNSWIIIWSDHGEEFYEHKGFSHGHTLYNELITVPLVITEPGWRKRHRVVDSPVELIDVAPTLCDLLGFKIPSQFQGRSLAALFRNEGYTERESRYSELRPPRRPAELRTITTDRHKIICSSPKSGALIDRIELYDIIADPGELDNMSESPTAQETLASLLAATQSIGCDGAGQDRTAPILDEELRERLRTIGYL
jgi:arylsulfatase A-like enzyme